MDVNAQVNRELEFIPKGGLSQNLLRMNYQMLRSNTLGVSAEERLSAQETLERAEAMVRQHDSAFTAKYDARLLNEK